MTRMRKAQLFSQDIIFAMMLILFTFSLWLTLRDRVVTMISASEDKRQIDEAASNALGQLLESPGEPTNWNDLDYANDTTVWSIGLASDRNVLDSSKVSAFVTMANSGGDNYTTIKKFLGLNNAGYKFNLTISWLNGTALNQYSINYTPSLSLYNASFAMTNTTVSIDRFALLNNSLVKVTMGVWIE
jgi:hypothetical protein